MALPRRGSRNVRVDGRDYRWLIRKKTTYVQGAQQAEMRLAVQSADTPLGQVLLVRLGVSRPDNWISPHQTPITPARVREIIRAGLLDGWRPQVQGSAHVLTFPVIREAG